jgi:hypothetical protein
MTRTLGKLLLGTPIHDSETGVTCGYLYVSDKGHALIMKASYPLDDHEA